MPCLKPFHGCPSLEEKAHTPWHGINVSPDWALSIYAAEASSSVTLLLHSPSLQAFMYTVPSALDMSSQNILFEEDKNEEATASSSDRASKRIILIHGNVVTAWGKKTCIQQWNYLANDGM